MLLARVGHWVLTLVDIFITNKQKEIFTHFMEPADYYLIFFKNRIFIGCNENILFAVFVSQVLYLVKI